MFEPVDATQIADAIRKIFDSEENFASEYISLCEVVSIYQKIIEDQSKVKENLETIINTKLQSINKQYSANIQEFDYDELTFCVTVCNENCDHKMAFYFYKEKNVISLLKAERSNKKLKNILTLIKDEVNEWYDYCYKLKEFATQQCWGIQVSDSAFFVNISHQLTSVYYGEKCVLSKFLLVSCYENKKNYYKCKFENGDELMKGKEDKFVEKILLKITDCPEWMQEQLYKIRKEQLERKEKERQEEAARLLLLAKKQKKRKILKRIFPFIKW